MKADVLKKFDKLEQSRKELFLRLEPFSAEELRWKAASDSWSVIQVLNHLLIVENGTSAYIAKKNQAAEIPASGFSAALRSALLSLFLRSPFKATAPARIGNPANNLSVQEIDEEWSRVNKNFRELISSLSDSRMASAIFKHPRVGYLSIPQTIDFLQNHFQRHRRQIERVLREAAVQKQANDRR